MKKLITLLLILSISIVSNSAFAMEDAGNKSKRAERPVIDLANYAEDDGEESSEPAKSSKKKGKRNAIDFDLSAADDDLLLELAINDLKEPNRKKPEGKIDWANVTKKYAAQNANRTKGIDKATLKKVLNSRFTNTFSITKAKRHKEYANRRSDEGFPLASAKQREPEAMEIDFDASDYNAHPERYFFVGPSSIIGNPGFGLYVRNPLPNGLQSLPAGLTLPHPYPGLKISRTDYFNELLEFLCRLTRKYDGAQNKSFDSPEVKEDLKRLETFGITVQLPYATVAGDTHIDWDNLNDRFVDYSFDMVGRGPKELTLYWPHYTHKGNVVFDYQSLENMTLVANEPPPYDFINLYTLTLQKSNVSLRARENRIKSTLSYVTTREVHAGEELFIAYGPTYTANRRKLNYSINLSKIDGCGMHELAANYFPKLDEQQYNSEKNLHTKLSIDPDNKDYAGFAEYFKGVTQYEHDPVVKIADLDEAKIALFAQATQNDYAGRYFEAKQEFAPSEAAVAIADVAAPQAMVRSASMEDFLSNWFNYVCGFNL